MAFARDKPGRFVPQPFHETRQFIQFQQGLPGVIALTQLMLRGRPMDRIVAGTTHPKGTGDHIFPVKLLLEALLAMQTLGDQVMAGKPGNGTFAELAMIGLGWELDGHGQWYEPAL